MRCLLSTLAVLLSMSHFVGCRSQSTAMTNPFLAPDRVPPPSTRTLLPGTAQPYYSGGPAPNTPVIGTPPGGFAPGTTLPPTTTPTFAPQPAGTVPPGGWNNSPQAIPPGSASRNFAPGNVQQASASLPVASPAAVSIQPDNQNLRFGGSTTQPQVPTINDQQYLPPDPSILPTPQLAVPPAGFQQEGFQQPIAQPTNQLLNVPQSAPVSNPRDVLIRAISSDNLSADGTSRARDGFRPQGSSQVRKPSLVSRLAPRRVEPSQPAADRFGFDPQLQWLRGQLDYAPETGLWSLRYGTGQASADPFGGSLAIANPQVLGGLQPGDFVQLRGRVDQSAAPGLGAAPAYNVSVVQRQRI